MTTSQDKQQDNVDAEQGNLKDRRDGGLYNYSQVKLLSELHVPINVQIGAIELSVQDIIDLMAGSIFQFEFDPNKLVSLTIGETEIAKAHFIKVDGNVALEIVSVIPY